VASRGLADRAVDWPAGHSVRAVAGWRGLGEVIWPRLEEYRSYRDQLASRPAGAVDQQLLARVDAEENRLQRAYETIRNEVPGLPRHQNAPFQEIQNENARLAARYGEVQQLAVTVEPLRELTAAQRRQLDDEVDLVGAVMQATPTLTVGSVRVGPHA